MDAAINPRAVMGDNEPPLGGRLTSDYADLIKRATDAAALVPDVLRPIASDEEAQAHTDTAVDIKKVIAAADESFEAEKKYWRDGAKTVDEFFAFRKVLDAAVRRVTGALDARANLLLAQRRAAEAQEAERARVAAAVETERQQKEAEAFDDTPPPVVVAPYVPPTPVKDVARVVSSSGNKASAALKWIHELTNRDEIPREYLMVDEEKIKLAIKRGVREIPGVRIFEAAKTSIRG